MIDGTAPTLSSLLRRAFSKYREDPIGTFAGETWTYGTVWDRAGKLTTALQDQGHEKGTFVGTMMSNQLDYFTAMLACVRGGFVNVPMNDMLTEAEFRYMFEDSGAAVAIVGEGFTDTFAEIRAELPDLKSEIATEADPPAEMESLDQLIADSTPLDGTVPVDPDDMLQLSYTGGTTGRPKGARHTHATFAMDAIAHAMDLEIHYGEEMLLMTPLPHAAGYMMVGGFLKGAHITITQGFDPADLLRFIEEGGTTWTFLVPTMIYRTLDHPDLADRDVSGIETIVYGAAPITPERLQEALEAFGPVFVQLYGQTEMPDVGTVLTKADHVREGQHRHSCGRPATLVDVRIADADNPTDTDPVATGEVGEVLLRSPYVMAGYHNKPDQTNETLVNGWLRTGDIGRMDEHGYVYLLDRASDMIISGGMNVYTTEVEDVIDQHPDVNQVAVIGIPDDDWGEAVHAVIIPEGEVTAADIHAFADDNLADYKKPKSIDFVESIPETPYGKMDKKALREPYWENHDREIT